MQSRGTEQLSAESLTSKYEMQLQALVREYESGPNNIDDITARFAFVVRETRESAKNFFDNQTREIARFLQGRETVVWAKVIQDTQQYGPGIGRSTARGASSKEAQHLMEAIIGGGTRRRQDQHRSTTPTATRATTGRTPAEERYEQLKATAAPGILRAMKEFSEADFVRVIGTVDLLRDKGLTDSQIYLRYVRAANKVGATPEVGRSLRILNILTTGQSRTKSVSFGL